ncbi:cytochrome P450 [Nocardia paucivorans]|uniref:cytochrome P450 n=1 Tax=Nocardia paucivorans TaxID=114259 RepID=UPI0002F980F8|nr:cytochrome P450 [Nocardia paucivorans]
MTKSIPSPETPAAGCPYSAPGQTDAPTRVALYTEEYAADPHRVFAEMRRRHRTLVPVDLAPGIPATLVIGYHTAIRIFNDPEHFPADARAWEKTVPADHPLMPMMAWRPNVMRSTGREHARYRQAITAALDGVDLFSMHQNVEEVAAPLIDAFCMDGEAELIGQYAFPLTFHVLNAMLGCPPELGESIATGMAAMFEGGDAATEANDRINEALLELVALKRVEPGRDVTSRLLAHPARLQDSEMVHQLAVLYGAGIEPLTNLTVNTLLFMITDPRFTSASSPGAVPTTRDALNELLYTDPPMANYCLSYPRQPIMIDGVWLPADQPVLISMSACNNDPAIHSGEYTDNNAHLAWGSGPHACPARSIAYTVAQNAIDQLLDALPEMRLACEVEQLRWRPGPFHRALVAMPVTFPPAPPLGR